MNGPKRKHNGKSLEPTQKIVRENTGCSWIPATMCLCVCARVKRCADAIGSFPAIPLRGKACIHINSDKQENVFCVWLGVLKRKLLNWYSYMGLLFTKTNSNHQVNRVLKGIWAINQTSILIFKNNNLFDFETNADICHLLLVLNSCSNYKRSKAHAFRYTNILRTFLKNYLVFSRDEQ